MSIYNYNFTVQTALNAWGIFTSRKRAYVPAMALNTVPSHSLRQVGYMTETPTLQNIHT